MVALFGATVGQIINAIIIGNRLEPAALSVMVIALPIHYIFATMGALLSVGGTAVCARAIGKGRVEECHTAFTMVYILTLISAAVLSSILFFFLEPLVRFLGAAPEIFEDTKRYAGIMIAGGVFTMSMYPAFNLLRLDGRTRLSAALFFIMAAVNILLDIILLFGLKTGVEGAAIATIGASAVSGCLGAILLFRGSRNFRFTLPGFRKAAREAESDSVSQITRDILILGSPSAMENLCTVLFTIVLNNLIAASFGLLALSAFKVIDSINAFAQIFIFGVSGPIIPFVAVFCVEKDTQSVRQILLQAFKWGALSIIVYTALCEIAAPGIAGLFGLSSPEALTVAVPAIRIFAASLIPALINTALIYTYQAENRPLLANILTFLRLFLLIIAAALFFSPRIGVTGVWHSFWIAESLTLLSALVLSFYYRHNNKNLLPILLLDREAEKNGTYKSFSVNNTLESITQSSAGITEFCELNDMSRKLTMSISLAIEETLVVIRSHCLPEDDRETMNVRILITDEIVILRIRHGGKLFNPVDYANRADEIQKMDVMGIKMILALAEKIDYRNTFGINNITILLGRQKSAGVSEKGSHEKKVN
jgi:Na+-driven multidrug efflux pump